MYCLSDSLRCWFYRLLQFPTTVSSFFFFDIRHSEMPIDSNEIRICRRDSKWTILINIYQNDIALVKVVSKSVLWRANRVSQEWILCRYKIIEVMLSSKSVSEIIRDRGMKKNRERENGRRIVQNPSRTVPYEDSGIAISGELDESSFSGECEGIISLQALKGIEQDANPDPRFEYRHANCCKLLNDGMISWVKIDLSVSWRSKL